MDVILSAVEEAKGKKVALKAITCSNYHAILGFMLAAGMNFDVVSKEMSEIKKLFTIFSDIQSKFK